MQKDHYKGLIAEWYDDWLREYRHDIDFYTGYFKEFEGRVLELGCGTGRILLPLAQASIQIDGLDSSSEMLGILADKARKAGIESIGMINQPMEDFDLGREYEAVFVASGSFQLLTSKNDALRSLQCIRKHLLPNGFFLLDIFVPWEAIKTQTQRSFQVTRDVTRNDVERSVVMEIFEVDIANQIKHSTYRYEFFRDECQVESILDDLDIRWYWKEEFQMLLGEAGFSEVEILTSAPVYKEGESFVFKAIK